MASCVRILVVLLILFSSAQANEIGIASTFFDRIVACPPKRINPYKTWGIAHKTLPCGTMVEIENLRTKKKVTAPVIDVGPCTSAQCQAGTTAAYRRAKKRKFDLLPEVAAKIGSSGLALVSLRVIR